MNTNIQKEQRLVYAVVMSWLLVGTLDLLAAILQTILADASIERLMRYIASGVFGETALNGGAMYSVLGLIFHYTIALSWTILFFLVYPRVKVARFNWLLVGIGYGAVIWFVMNRIVLPLSNTPQRPFDLQRSIIAALVLMVAIGIPLSVMAKRHFSRTSAGERNG